MKKKGEGKTSTYNFTKNCVHKREGQRDAESKGVIGITQLIDFNRRSLLLFLRNESPFSIFTILSPFLFPLFFIWLFFPYFFFVELFFFFWFFCLVCSFGCRRPRSHSLLCVRALLYLCWRKNSSVPLIAYSLLFFVLFFHHSLLFVSLSPHSLSSLSSACSFTRFLSLSLGRN